MLKVEIRPFSDEHLDEAARLLAERHGRHRAAEPLLPDRVDYRAQIEAELRDERAAGVVALTQGKLAGYLVGQVRQDACVVDLAGCAATEAEFVRDLYSELASAWVDEGHLRHRVYVPASELPLVDAWFRLAFGLQFTFAVRETAPEPPVEAGVEIRPGHPADLDAAAGSDRLLWEHQRSSPSFSGLTIPDDDHFRSEWRDTWDDPDFTHFVAERDGRSVGHTLLYRRRTGDLRIPERSIDLAHVVTLPEVRGSGVGLALTAHALAWAHEAGYVAMTTDWRIGNLLSSRFWPSRGFRPTFLRLYRHVP